MKVCASLYKLTLTLIVSQSSVTQVAAQLIPTQYYKTVLSVSNKCSDYFVINCCFVLSCYSQANNTVFGMRLSYANVTSDVIKAKVKAETLSSKSKDLS